MSMWTYANWDTANVNLADKLSALAQHIEEVSQKIRPDMNSGPGGVSTGELLEYRRDLEARQRELRSAVAAASATFVRGICQ